VPEQTWARARELLLAAEEPVLACHVSPDGDALGSMLALAHALCRLGRRFCATFSEPFLVPETLSGLPGLDLLRPPDAVPARPALLVTFDTGSADRLGSLAPLAGAADEVLVLDHHASNTGFGTCSLLDRSAAATAVVAAELIDRLGVELDVDIAACLYTGLVADTGSFKFAATTPAVHLLAARLLATGIRHDLISRQLWDTRPFGYLPLLGTVLRRAVLEPDAVSGLGLTWTYSTLDDLVALGLGADQVEGVIDVVRTAREAEVACVVKEVEDGELVVSLRSKGRVDVGAVCVALGGGGHRFAAGFTARGAGGVEAAVQSVRSALAAAPILPA